MCNLMIEPRKLNQKSDRHIWRIADSLDLIYEKSKDLEIKGVRDTVLRHMILFKLCLANLLQISNNFSNFFKAGQYSFHRCWVK